MKLSRGALVWGAIPLLLILLAAGGVRLWTYRPANPTAIGPARPTPEKSAELCPIQLTDVSAQTGIDFIHTDGSSGRYYIVETVTAGLAIFDYDGDEIPDIYFLNGAALPGCVLSRPATNALYRNLGQWQFSNVSQPAGVADPGYGLGVAAADYNHDGFPDLFVNNFGPNVLYRNNGDGTFTDTTLEAGVAGGNLVGAGAAFLDADLDSDLDLYVANYVDFNFENHVMHFRDGYPEYAGPRDYRPVPDFLYFNNGDGTFTDASEVSGVGLVAGTGMGLVAADYDNDGDTDVFVLNDVAQNFLFRNDGTGRFEEVAVTTGAAYNGYGDELGSMGIDCGDYDGDGWLDFFMTSYQNEFPVLYRNLGNGLLEDVTAVTGAGSGCYAQVNWGTGLVDLDNDGDLDLFVACGHLQDKIDFYDQSTSYCARNVVLMNTGNGKFVNISDRCGDGLAVRLSSRGAAFCDLDGDGDSDIVVLNSRREPTIIRNDSPGGHWIRIKLLGTRSNRDGVGARVAVTAGGKVQVAQVHSGRGYQSHWGLILPFGLAAVRRLERLEIRWPGGQTQEWRDLEADQSVMVIEGLPGWLSLPKSHHSP